jgi:phosphosulfolactate synthase (CoM biosynthesis protein A)
MDNEVVEILRDLLQVADQWAEGIRYEWGDLREEEVAAIDRAHRWLDKNAKSD